MGIVHRLLQLVIVGYIIGYIVVWKKGYQEFQEPHGTSVIKVKGIARVSGSNSSFYSGASSDYIWDAPEYEIPPIENNAFFIATRQTVTYGQTQGVCPTALDDNLLCTTSGEKPCIANKPTSNTFGILTGECVPSPQNDTLKVCQMAGWCPEELTDSVDYKIDTDDLRSFTVFLKTMVTFSMFKKNLRNIRDTVSLSCRFDGTAATAGCPIIPVGYILDQLVHANQSALLFDGGLIEIQQDWICNFDLGPNSCTPTYTFSLLQSGDDKLSPGINYRFAQKYRVNETEYRTLTKMYGLRFVISITGKGGQFNIVNLFVAIGSGIGFMVIAGIVCDAILMYVHRSRLRYRQGKFSVCIVDGDAPTDTEILVRP